MNRIHKPVLSFGLGAAVGTAAGLIGLGGAQFRLPAPVGALRYTDTAREAVALNLVSSFIVLAAASRLPVSRTANRDAAHWFDRRRAHRRTVRARRNPRNAAPRENDGRPGRGPGPTPSRPDRAGRREDQALQAHRPALRKDEDQRRILLRQRHRLHLEPIRLHCLTFILGSRTCRPKGRQVQIAMSRGTECVGPQARTLSGRAGAAAFAAAIRGSRAEPLAGPRRGWTNILSSHRSRSVRNCSTPMSMPSWPFAG